jgi:hypothetical protein
MVVPMATFSMHFSMIFGAFGDQKQVWRNIGFFAWGNR